MTNPRNDRIFKQIFHHHPCSLMHLLNAFLPLQDPIVEVEYMPEELQTESDGYLMSIVDVRCRDGAGRGGISSWRCRCRRRRCSTVG